MTTHINVNTGGSAPQCQPIAVQIGNAALDFTEVQFADLVITGAQLAEAARAFPVEDHVILHLLPSKEMETIRPTEMVTLTPGSRFLVIKGDRTHRFTVDGRALEWPLEDISGLAILTIIGREDDEIELVLDRSDAPDRVIDQDDVVRLDAAGTERLRTRPARWPITIEVDGEPYQPPNRRMTPNEIIIGATGRDPSTNYLVRITQGGRISYEGKGTRPIRLRDGMRFQVISTGPTPVSDPQMKQGVTAFTEGLRSLGYEPSPLSSLRDHVTFDYVVESGKFAGKKVRLGLVIPPDFPMTPPSGPYVSPEIHPIFTSGAHPTGAIHKDQARVFEQHTGNIWQYWSRPFHDWGRTKRSVAAYMSHIWKLWDSQ